MARPLKFICGTSRPNGWTSARSRPGFTVWPAPQAPAAVARARWIAQSDEGVMKLNGMPFAKEIWSIVILLSLGKTEAAEFTEAPADVGISPTERWFERGRFEATLDNGVLFSPFGSPRSRPRINYTVTGIQ